MKSPHAADEGARTDQRELSKQAARGFGWVAMIRYTNRLTGFVTTLILAKFVAPDAFGLIAVATMVMELVNLMKDMGMSQALIFRREQSARTSSTAFFLLICVNAVIVTTVCLSAPLLSAFFEDPSITPVVIVMSSSLLLFALRSVPDALLRKEMAFSRLVIPSVVPAIVGSVVSIVMAVQGFGVWSLVARALLVEGLSTILIWKYSPFRPSLVFDTQVARELLSYGRYIIGASIFGVCLYNIDRLYVGKMIDVSALGLYVLGYTLANVPVGELGHMVCRVMLPALSKVNEDLRIFREGLSKTLELSAMISIALGVGIATFGPELVRSIFDEEWWPMARPLQVLAVAATFRSVSTLIAEACKAIGSPQLVQWTMLYRLIVVSILGFVGVYAFGILGLAWAILIAYASAFAGEVFVLGPFVGMKPGDFFRVLIWPILLAVAAIPTSYWVTTLWADSDLLQLLVGGPLSVALFVVLVSQFRRRLIRTVWAATFS